MIGIILLNGEPYKGKIDVSGKFVVACDGGYAYAEKNGIKCNLILGDFDSLGYKPEGAEVFPVEKDYTDGELALIELKKRGITDIEIYCGAGKRDDHYFGNIGLLVKGDKLGLNVKFVTDYTEFVLKTGKVVFSGRIRDTVSVIPVTEKIRISESYGLKYPAAGLDISLGDSTGLSNVILKENAYIEITEGKALIFSVKKVD
ncbi:MAG: thiamine diphosphokinase [Christensenellaceae bacterium]|nr:thiamine diphosphokinase [Christensenellaceae bacterium]MDD6927335.1 thiamine diphosphokinase [bacterium]MDY2850703.1 thiamine diphosphokinase [Christensenellaceae bacterium]